MVVPVLYGIVMSVSKALAGSQRRQVTDLITAWHFQSGLKDGISRIFWGLGGPEEGRNFSR